MDNLFEQSKKFFMIFVSVFCFAGAILAFIPHKLMFAVIESLALKTETKKKLLKEWNSDFRIYNFL